MTVGFGVVAVGAVVAGAVFSAQSTNAGNNAQGLANSLGAGACEGGSAQCAQLKSDSDTANNERTLSIAFYAGAGACAAGAVLSWFFLPKTVEARSAVVPMVGPGVAGATWVTTF
jgi:Na+-driven multidrug efflux pump